MYDIIKKQNGERFAQAIRKYDNGIFDIPNIDKIVRYAGNKAEPIMNYLLSLKHIEIKEQNLHQDPIKLLKKAGYNAEIADTLEKQNAIQKYFIPQERLCTFNDCDRFREYYIINVVHKDADKIQRSPTPNRDDKYGTSVMSIQILKSGGFIKITNRYNHGAGVGCDNTLNSNPDNIIAGLSDAIKHHFNVDFSSQRVSLPDNYILVDDKICHFNNEVNNVYCGTDFYVKNGRIFDIDKNSQIMLGSGYLYDNKRRTVINLTNENMQLFDARILDGKKLQIKKDLSDGSYLLYADNEIIFGSKDGMINYLNPKNSSTVILRHAKLHGDLDFSNVKFIDLQDTDMSQANTLKLSPNADTIKLDCAKLPACELDFSNTNTLDLFKTDLRHVTSLKTQKNTPSIDLSYAILPATKLDLRGVTQDVKMHKADLSRITGLELHKNVNNVDLSATVLPAIKLNLGDVTNTLDLYNTDLSRVTNITFPKDISYMELRYAKMPACNLDISGEKNQISLNFTDLSRITGLKLNKKLHSLNLQMAKLPAIDLDLSSVVHLINLHSADLSRIISLKIPNQIRTMDLRNAKLPATKLNLEHVQFLLLYEADLSRVTNLQLPRHIQQADLETVQLPKYMKKNIITHTINNNKTKLK